MYRNLLSTAVCMAVALTSRAHAQAPPNVVTFTSETQPDGVFSYGIEAFGGMTEGPSRIAPRNPADKSQILPSFYAISLYGLSFVYQDNLPIDESASQRVLLKRGTPATFDISDYLDSDPTILESDVVDEVAKTRTATFRLAPFVDNPGLPQSILASIHVTLTQQMVGQQMVQTYVLGNDHTDDVELRVLAIADSDIDYAPTGGWTQNYVTHDPKWSGGDPGGGSMTALDRDRRLGHTIALSLESGLFEGWRARTGGSAPGYEVMRGPYFYGYPADTLNAIFFGAVSSISYAFSNDVDDDADDDADNDVPRDITMSLQGRLVIPAGDTRTVIVTHTLFAFGPWALTCPIAAAELGAPVNVPVITSGGYGARTVGVTGLPEGLSFAGGAIVGAIMMPGEYSYTVTVSDEGGHSDTLVCPLPIVGPCLNDPIDQGCVADVVYVVLDQGGVPSGTARCIHYDTGAVLCDADPPASGVLRVYPDLWCPGVEE